MQYTYLRRPRDPVPSAGVMAPYVLGFPDEVLSGTGQDPSSLCQSSQLDEADSIAAAQEEWLASHKRQGKRKQRNEMASRLLAIGEDPGKDFFRLLAHKLAEYNVPTPAVQIEYKNLTVRTQAVIGTAGIPTAGNFGPQLVKAALRLNKGQTQRLTILDGLNGVLKPGRCTLLLGPPGSGKSTFLRVLGNRMRGAQRLQVTGQVLYNGHSKDEFVVQRTTALVDQHDSHIPNLTVGETVDFAHTCHRGYREPEFNLSGELSRAKVKSMSQAIMQRSASPTPLIKAAPEHYPSTRTVNRVDPGATADSIAAAMQGEEALQQQLRHGSILDEVEQLITQAWGTGVKTEVVLRLLGLGHCRDTLVGDGGLMLRGISGGERKRLTTAEMVVGPQRVLLMDEISTGLDSATLHSVITFFTSMSHALNLTTVISLLQPPPEVFNLFDDLLLLVGGKMLFHGPLQQALPHFTAMGFQCPTRKDVPSFLLEITTPAGQREFASRRLLEAAQPQPDHDGMLLTLQGMASCFWTDSSAGTSMMQQLSEPFNRSASHPAALEHRRYALTPLQAVAVVTRRQMTLVLRDKLLLRGRLLQIVVVSLMVGSLFFQLGHSVSDARSFFGAAFMVILFMSMGTMPQIGVVMAQKAVWLKHRDSLLYPGYAHGLAMALSQLPVSILEATLFSCISYFMIGFHAQAGYFFIFWLVVAASNLCLSALFRLLAVLAPNPTLAAAYGGLALLILILTSGFAIVRRSIPTYWIWAYYLSPFAYGLRALVINEFTSPDWGQKVIGVPGANTMGKAALTSFDFHTDRDWIGIGILFLVTAYILLSAATCLALDWVNGPQQQARVTDSSQVAGVHEGSAKQRSILQQGDGIGSKGRGAPAPALSRLSRSSSKHSGAAGPAPAERNITTAVVIAPSASTFGAQNVVRRNSGSQSGDKASAIAASKHDGGGTDSWEHVKAVNINMTAQGLLNFMPITLVFQDLRYFVPNPAYKRRGIFGIMSGSGGSSSSSSSHVCIDAEAGSTTTPASRRVSTGSIQSHQTSSTRSLPRENLLEKWQGSHLPVAGSGSSSSLSSKEWTAAARGGLADQPKELELLKGVSGYAVPGKLMALMGGSGAGKTTLMDVICGRKTVGRTTGRLMINGRRLVKAPWSRVVGYVEQMDVHTAAQTVTEALWFSGRLRLGRKFSDQQVRAYVQQVIDTVDLTEQSFSLVGTPGGPNGLSTEQLKRLTIAVELVANPSVMFMDEPTSGLDARAAAIVMRAVRNVALSGRTVMVTIHQPSIEIFEAFDTLLLLQRGGRTTYFGPLGHESSLLIQYLQSEPGTVPLAPGHNPATWMLEVTGGSMAVVTAANNTDWPAVYAASRLAAANAAEAKRLVAECAASSQPLRMSSMYAQPFLVQIRELLVKYWLVYWRTPSYTLARCFLTLCVAFIYGSMYYKAGVLPKPYASIGNVQNIMGIIFSSTNFLGMTNLMSVMPLVGMERVVFYRERGALPYDAFAYGIAIALVDIPYLLVQALVFVPVVYAMVGFQASFEKFVYYLLMFLASISFYTIFGQFMVYTTPSQQTAQVAGAGLNFIFNIFNGFVIAFPAMPGYWKWLNRMVPTTWVLYGLGVSQLGDVTGHQVQFAGRRMSVSKFTNMLFEYDYDMRWWCLMIVVGYLVFFRVTSILALKYINFLRR